MIGVKIIAIILILVGMLGLRNPEPVVQRKETAATFLPYD